MKTKFLFLTFFIGLFLWAQCFVNNANYQNQYNVFSSSGNWQLDNMYYNNAKYLAEIFNLTVFAGFYDDSQTGPNAFASPSPNYQDGDTFFGINLINQYIYTSGYEAYNKMIFTMAHEFAHIYQFKHQGPNYWSKVKYAELQADYLAGGVLMKFLLDNVENYKKYGYYDSSSIINSIIESASNHFYSIGDTNFGHPQHHGTPSQRKNAFLSGMEDASKLIYTSQDYYGQNYHNIDVPNLYKKSFNYINSL